MKEYLQFWPQIYILVILILRLLKQFFFAGQERDLKFQPFTGVLLLLAEMFVLIYGGFFSYWGGAQVIFTILYAVVFFICIILLWIYFNKPENTTVKSKVSSISWTDFISVGLLFWGGFFDGLIKFLTQ